MEAGGAGHKGRSSLEENLEPRHVTVNAGRDVMKKRRRQRGVPGNDPGRYHRGA